MHIGIYFKGLRWAGRLVGYDNEIKQSVTKIKHDYLSLQFLSVPDEQNYREQHQQSIPQDQLLNQTYSIERDKKQIDRAQTIRFKSTVTSQLKSLILFKDAGTLMAIDGYSHKIQNTALQLQDRIICHFSSRQNDFFYLVSQVGIIYKIVIGTTDCVSKRDLAPRDELVCADLYYEPQLYLIKNQDSLVGPQKIPFVDKYIVIGGHKGIVSIYDMVGNSCLDSLEQGDPIVCIRFLSNREQLGVVLVTQQEILKLLWFYKGRLQWVRDWKLPSQATIHVDHQKLFMALVAPPYTFSIFSYKCINTLILKSLQGAEDTHSPVHCIDTIYERKVVITSSIDEIMIYNFKKALIARLRYFQPIIFAYFINFNEDIIVLGGDECLLLILHSEILKRSQFKKSVVDKMGREGQSFMLSMNDFFDKPNRERGISDKQNNMHSTLIHPYFRVDHDSDIVVNRPYRNSSGSKKD